jgi:predicted RNase H-like HicB family nuclease
LDFVYAAVFEPNDDGSYTVAFPDLPGCISEGKDLPDALRMAERALSQRIEYMGDMNLPSPVQTDISAVKAGKGALVSLVCARLRDNKAIRRTVSIPKWMDEQASVEGLSLSRVLQDALKTRLTT